MNEWIVPDWPASERVRALITTRHGGHSAAPFDSLNLGDHVGDDPACVRRNRALLRQHGDLPGEPLWLNQVHGCAVAGCHTEGGVPPEADASTTTQPGRICAVMTADCLPLLICDLGATRVAAIHAGWRGLVNGVIERSLACFSQPGEELMVWLGPAIGPAAFEVGEEVRAAFVAVQPEAAPAFTTARPGHWFADIYQLARLRLQAAGVGYIGGGGYCTHSDSARFFSYRRDGVTGRMASLIWLE
ncbi:MAG: peptidoglycan editing factor PgeF [Gammaproteobacteria bacterium]|nr:peptidoglycan editing factor PgeF [Gammaproteobacteria bacterium]